MRSRWNVQRNQLACVVCRRQPRLRRRLMAIRQEQIADREDQVARAAIPDGDLMAGAEPVEYWNPYAEERNSKPLRSLASMRMSDHEIRATRARFKVFQVT